MLRKFFPYVLVGVLFITACGKASTTTPATQTPEAETTTSATETDGEATPVTDTRQTIVFLGNSLAAGFGIDPALAFPALIQQKIDSLGWPFRVVNAGISGDTSAGGKSRIQWLLDDPIDVLVLELGGNDGLRGINLDLTKANLQAIIDATKARYPAATIVLAGMQVPPNLGQAYTAQFRDMYPALAEENNAALIPFLLEGVGGIPALNLPDGIHPTAAGHEIVTENVWAVLEPILAARRTDS